jgi:hypothetical protein
MIANESGYEPQIRSLSHIEQNYYCSDESLVGVISAV